MRAAALLGACAIAAVVVLGFTILGGGSSGRAARPKLELVRSGPLTVRGRHFRSDEPVKLAAGRKITPAKANGDGVFVVTIRGATRCDTTRVLARGSAGSYAVLKLLPSPACLPARAGG
jgi:hypothetical protein